MSQKIHHVMNATLVSGPESLVIPNLQGVFSQCEFLLLQEKRNPEGAKKVFEYVKNHGFKAHEVTVRSKLDLFAIVELAFLWRKEKPAIIHTHGPKTSVYVVGALAVLKVLNPFYNPILITTHHGVRANDFIPKLKLFENLYEKIAMPFFHKILTVCSSDKELLIRRGINGDKISVHWNGVDRKQTLDSERDRFKKTVIADWSNTAQENLEGYYLIGIVGRLALEKRYKDCFKVALALKSTGKKFKMLCFGSGPLEKELREEISKLQLNKDVFLMGYRAKISEEIVALDCMLSLSVAEGLPIALVEAGWAKLPVIATAVDGVKDLLAEESGILVNAEVDIPEITKAIESLMNDSEKSSQLASRFYKRVIEKFSRKAWVSEIQEVYKSITS